MKKFHKRNEKNMQCMQRFSFTKYNSDIDYGNNYYILNHKVVTRDKSQVKLETIVIEKNEWQAYVNLLIEIYKYANKANHKNDENSFERSKNQNENCGISNCVIKCLKFLDSTENLPICENEAFNEDFKIYFTNFPEKYLNKIENIPLYTGQQGKFQALFNSKKTKDTSKTTNKINPRTLIKNNALIAYHIYKFHFEEKEKEVKNVEKLSNSPTKQRSKSVEKKLVEVATSPNRRFSFSYGNKESLNFSPEKPTKQEKIDELNNAKSKLENDLNQVKKLNEKLSQDNSKLENELNNTKESLISLQNEIKNIKNELDNSNKKVQEQENLIKKNIDELNSNQAEIQKLKNDYEQLKYVNKKINEEKEKFIEENKQFKSENEQLKANLKKTEESEINLKEQIKNLKKENETTKNQFEKSKKELQAKEIQINQNQTEIQTLKTENENLQNEFNKSKKQIDELNKMLKEKEELISKNDLNQAEIQKLKLENEQLNIDLANLKKDQNAKDSKVDETINELNQAKKILENELQDLKTSKNEVDESNEKLRQQIEELNKKIREQNEIVAKNESYQTEIGKLKSEKEQLEKSLNESKTSLTNLQTEIENLKSSKNKTDNLNKDLQNQIKELKEKEVTKESIETQVTTNSVTPVQNKNSFLTALLILSLIIGSVLLVAAIILCPPVSAAIGFTIFATKTAGFILTGILSAFGILIPFFGFFAMKNFEHHKNVSDLNKNNLLPQENESIFKSQNKDEKENGKDLTNLDNEISTNSLIVNE